MEVAHRALKAGLRKSPLCVHGLPIQPSFAAYCHQVNLFLVFEYGSSTRLDLSCPLVVLFACTLYLFCVPYTACVSANEVVDRPSSRVSFLIVCADCCKCLNVISTVEDLWYNNTSQTKDRKKKRNFFDFGIRGLCIRVGAFMIDCSCFPCMPEYLIAVVILEVLGFGDLIFRSV